MARPNLVLITADHGEHLGDHGIWAKSTFLHGSGDVPLLLKPPRGHQISRPVVGTPVLTADICPTFLELAGLTPEDACDGRSLLTPEVGTSPRTIHGEIGGTAFACDGAYKYVWHACGGRELLFDVQADPENLHDLSNREELVPVKTGLRSSLLDYLVRFESPLLENGVLATKDPDRDPEALRRQNPYAWRGPMRTGQGYHGHKG